MAFGRLDRGGKPQPMSDINMTPLIDVMLVLLVIFILTAPLLNNAVHIQLPQTAATAAPDAVRAVTVSVDPAGKVFIDKREVALDALELELKGLLKANPELKSVPVILDFATSDDDRRVLEMVCAAVRLD